MRKHQISAEAKIILVWVVLLSGLMAGPGPVVMADPPGWRITQLTDNSYVDRYPQISGPNVVWHGWDGSDYEIFFYDGITTSQLTDNSFSDEHPQISGSNVVWERYDGSDWEIFFYDGTTTTQLTDNSFNDDDPQISGSNIVWWGYDGNDDEVFMAVPCEYSLPGDVDYDCKVDFFDFAFMASNWFIDCIADPGNPACIP